MQDISCLLYLAGLIIRIVTFELSAQKVHAGVDSEHAALPLQVTWWPGAGQFRNGLHLKSRSSDLETFRDRNQIFKEERKTT